MDPSNLIALLPPHEAKKLEEFNKKLVSIPDPIDRLKMLHGHLLGLTKGLEDLIRRMEDHRMNEARRAKKT